MAEQEKPKSLLAGGIQGELIAVENLPDCLFIEEEQPGTGEPNYTAQRFFAKRPDDYVLCVTLIAGGIGLLRIARLLKVHHMTVAAVREREVDQIDIEKERIRRNIRLAVGIASERLPDIMATLAADKVPLNTAILLDKLRDLDGEPTHRVQVTLQGHLTHAAVAASLGAFPDAIDVTATGSNAGENAQKGPTQIGPGATPPAPSSDGQSDSKPS